ARFGIRPGMYLAETAPPGMAVLREDLNPWREEVQLDALTMVRLEDGRIMSRVAVIHRGSDVLLMTENGYYAGRGNYLDLAYLVTGERVQTLQDFPDFHRPDIVWQALEGKPVDKLPRLPGLSWEVWE
ncbi:MAG: hypothetical protein ACAI44_02320, partial [Candidatus Sericytochromatia bacterium]